MRDLMKVRKDHDLSQSEIAARMDMSQAAVSQLERHDANPTLNTVQRYALAVGARIHFEVIDDAPRVSTQRVSGQISFEPTLESPRRAETNWSSMHISRSIVREMAGASNA